MKVYLAGPMTAYKDDPWNPWNYATFNRVARRLREQGNVVLNPAEHFGGDTTLDKPVYMRGAIHAVLQADAIAMLPGWQSSSGALLESDIAAALGLTFYEVEERDNDVRLI